MCKPTPRPQLPNPKWSILHVVCARSLPPPFSNPRQVRVERLADFAPIPDTLLELYVPRKLHPETHERMKFFEKQFEWRTARKVWEAFRFYHGKSLPRPPRAGARRDA